MNKCVKSPIKLTSPEKFTATIAATTIKHSAPFYISSKLFRNKRLKQKRCKRAAAQRAGTYSSAKTDRRKQNLNTLKADFTIDLLSDDDAAAADSSSSAIPRKNCNRNNGKYGISAPPPSQQLLGNFPQTMHAEMHIEQLQLQLEQQQKLLIQQQEFTKNHLQHYYVYPGAPLELCKVPNITLIPVQPLAMQTLQQRNSSRRKRKSRPPKRHAEPTIVNNESIVLTDDSDTEANKTVSFQPAKQLASNDLSSTSTHAHAQVHTKSSTAMENSPTVHTLSSPPPLTPLKSAAAAVHLTSPTHTAQVDDEVTVSIVPRSSTAGSCSKPTANELFPMLPDETTVHTVIANRIYELSLTKLREGLASCGIADGQQKISPTRRKALKTNPPPSIAMPQQQQPVSLKLSSDLSISLISDDEDEQQQQQQQLNAEKLLQQQPQLSIQHVQLPAQPIATAADGRQLPRRRKLG